MNSGDTRPPYMSTEPSDETSATQPRLSVTSAWRQFVEVAKPYWTGNQRRTAWAWLAGLLVLMAAETQFAVMLNAQTGEVASAFAAREADRFWAAVRAMLYILVFAVPIYGLYYYARDAYSNHWRRWLTGRFLDGYLKNRTYYALNRSVEIDNPDQRIADDVNTFTARSLHFTLILIGSAMQLVAFSAVLWRISPTLVGVLALYAVGGTWLSLWLFGAPLIRLNFWQVRCEADFRFRLMRVRENAESIAFYRGEQQERGHLNRGLHAVIRNYQRLIRKQFLLNVFQRAFSQLSLLIPSVVLANQVLSGEMEVGQAVAAGGAFLAVLTAVSLIVDNFEGLSRFVAGIERLHTLAQAVFGTPTTSGAATVVTHTQAGAPPPGHGVLSLHDLSVQAPGNSRTLVNKLNLKLAPGESLLITGASGTGKSSILRTIAGLWTQGQGRMTVPTADDMFFLPQKPYLQHGSLRSQMIYPAAHTDLSDDVLLAILDEVQLGALAERVGGLDATHDWEKLLSGGEQQRLAFARVLVHKPKVAVLDEATSALDAANEATLYQRLRDRGTMLISIAHRAAVEKFHTKVLMLKGGGAWEVRRAKRDTVKAPPSQP